MNKSTELTTATQRALDLFDNANIAANLFEKTIGLAQGTIKNLKNGKNLISADCIIKFSRYFNVSADYLLCLTNEPKPLENHEVEEISDNTPTVFGAISDLLTDNQFVDSAKLYRAFPDEKKERVYAYILGIATGLGLPLNQILGRK